jgi:hypothetical protein
MRLIPLLRDSESRRAFPVSSEGYTPMRYVGISGIEPEHVKCRDTLSTGTFCRTRLVARCYSQARLPI